MRKLTMVLILMLVASLSMAQGFTSSGGGGGGATQADIDKALADVSYRQTWSLPITYSPNGEAYIGGYYDLASSAATFTTATTHGTVDGSYAAHFMIVTGAEAVGDIIITITGDSITDSTNVVLNDTDTITITDKDPANTYLETSTKWLGRVSVIVTSGTPISCNYGYCKYWDNGNADFTVTGGEATWMGDVNGAVIDLELIHHKSTGWTYNAAAVPDYPTPLFTMSDAHGTNVEVNSNEYGCFKRTAPIGSAIAGNDSEGVLVKFSFSAAACLEYGQISLQYTQQGVADE